MALKDGYRQDFWPKDKEEWTDDYVYRETNSAIVNGTLNGQTDEVTKMWSNQYKAIARANTVWPIWRKRSLWVFPKVRLINILQKLTS